MGISPKLFSSAPCPFYIILSFRPEFELLKLYIHFLFAGSRNCYFTCARKEPDVSLLSLLVVILHGPILDIISNISLSK